jgi:hypothetical protein
MMISPFHFMVAIMRTTLFYSLMIPENTVLSAIKGLSRSLNILPVIPFYQYEYYRYLISPTPPRDCREAVC